MRPLVAPSRCLLNAIEKNAVWSGDWLLPASNVENLQACAFRDSYQAFKKAGAEVIGISEDTPESHKVCIISFPCHR